MTTPKYTLTNDCVSIILEGKTLTLRKGSPNFEKARSAVLQEEWEGIEKIFLPGNAVEQWLGSGFRLKEGRIFFGADPLPAELSGRMVRMAEGGANPTSLMKFWARLQNNPSMRSVEQLWGFLENKGIPLDEEGYFLAYKAVRSNYMDYHSNTILNKVGANIQMPRNKISDDPNHACHVGLHVGAIEYARDFGNSDRRIMICKVDPGDVVCVPYDHSQMKMRVCRYEVIAELSPNKQEFLSSTYTTSSDLKAAVVEPEPVEPEPVVVAPVKADPATFTYEEMQLMKLEDLRKYAKSLGLKNPGKILGGKDALARSVCEYVVKNRVLPMPNKTQP